MCSSSVHTFLVFDAFSMKPDGSDPVVFYSYPQSGQSQHFAVNQAGLLITFVKFCKRFRPTRDCDYILTRSRETALLELSDEIWISVSRDVADAPGRYYLISILQTYRRIYELFCVSFRILSYRKTDSNLIVSYTTIYYVFCCFV